MVMLWKEMEEEVLPEFDTQLVHAESPLNQVCVTMLMTRSTSLLVFFLELSIYLCMFFIISLSFCLSALSLFISLFIYPSAVSSSLFLFLSLSIYSSLSSSALVHFFPLAIYLSLDHFIISIPPSFPAYLSHVIPLFICSSFSFPYLYFYLFIL